MNHKPILARWQCHGEPFPGSSITVLFPTYYGKLRRQSKAKGRGHFGVALDGPNPGHSCWWHFYGETGEYPKEDGSVGTWTVLPMNKLKIRA